MPRDLPSYLEDIKLSISELDLFMSNVKSKDDFINNIEKVRAVERNIEIIGEAVKNLPESIRSEYKEVPWKKIAGIRDILAHAYFSVDKEILWDIVSNHIRNLSKAISKIENNH